MLITKAHAQHLKFYTAHKTALAYVTPIPMSFEVDTKEGRVYAKAGDWLAKDVDGDLYPIDAGVFARSYEWADPDGDHPAEGFGGAQGPR